MDCLEGAATGWTCDIMNFDTGDTCNKCGNGIREALEECDDGNLDNPDGCDSLCWVGTGGWTCTEDLNGLSTCVNCGDGII